MGLIISCALFLLLFIAGSGSGTTLIVDAGGGGDFETIQEGIDSAEDWDTLIVRDGTYAENVVVDKPSGEVKQVIPGSSLTGDS